MILSAGYLESDWCLKELRAAIQHGKQIIIVQDALYNGEVPKADHLADVRFLLETCPRLKWLAEFNSYCISALRSLIGGASQDAFDKLSWYIMREHYEELLINKRSFDRSSPAVANHWTLPFLQLQSCLEYYMECPVEALLAPADTFGFVTQFTDKTCSGWRNLNYIQVDKKVEFSSDGLIELVNRNYSTLKYINLRECDNIGDSGIEALANQCTGLESITLFKCKGITAAGYLHLAKCKSLQQLDISSTNFNDAVLKTIAEGCPQIKMLKLNGCTAITDVGVENAAKCLNDIVHMDLGFCTVSDKTAGIIAANYPNLEVLVLEMTKITDQGIKAIAMQCNRLKHIDLGGLNTIKPDAFQKLFETNPLLEELELRDSSVTDACIVQLVKSCPQVHTLSFYQAQGVTDQGVKILAEHCKNLKWLDISRQDHAEDYLWYSLQKPSITDVSLRSLADSCVTLEELFCDRCYGLTDEGALYLAKNRVCKNLKVLTMSNITGITKPTTIGKAFPKGVFRTGLEFPDRTAQEAEDERREMILSKYIKEKARKKRLDLYVGQAKSATGSSSALITNNIEVVPDSVFDNIKPEGANKSPKEFTICICYATQTGKPCVDTLKKHLNALGVTHTELGLDVTTVITPQEIESIVSSAKVVIAVMSKHALRVRKLVFAMEAALTYPVRPLIVHDADTCFFPGYSEQPESVKPLFVEKAVTFLSNYSEHVVDQIMEKVADHEHKPEVDLHAAMHQEDIKTRLFLSHKRTTAQHIAGRLYEGFKGMYKCFLDSEAQFQIHDLEHFVANTDIFVWILSEAYFESEFCMKELSAAVKFNKKIVIVLDIRYEIPSELPTARYGLTPEMISKVLKEAPRYTWISEYHNQCVQRMKEEVIGASDEGLALVLAKPELVEGINRKKFDSTFPLNMEQWTDYEIGRQDQMFYALKFNFGCSVTDVTGCVVTNLVQTKLLCKTFPEIESYTIMNSLVQDDEFEHIATLRNLRHLDLSDTIFVRDPNLKLIANCYELTFLSLRWCKDFSDEGIAALTQGCKKLQVLNMCRMYDTTPQLMTDKSLDAIARNCKDMTNLNLENWRNLTDHGLQKVIDNCPKLTTLNVLSCANLTVAIFAHMGQRAQNLQTLTTDVNVAKFFPPTVTILHTSWEVKNIFHLTARGRRKPQKK